VTLQYLYATATLLLGGNNYYIQSYFALPCIYHLSLYCTSQQDDFTSQFNFGANDIGSIASPIASPVSINKTLQVRSNSKRPSSTRSCGTSMFGTPLNATSTRQQRGIRGSVSGSALGT
jgi:hypothetical protein